MTATRRVCHVLVVGALVSVVPLFQAPREDGWSIYDARDASGDPLRASAGILLRESIGGHDSLVGRFQGALVSPRLDLLLQAISPMRASFSVVAENGASLRMECHAAECPFAFEPRTRGATYTLRWDVEMEPADAPPRLDVQVGLAVATHDAPASR